MSLGNFLENAMSRWMRDGGPEDDIILTSRIRIARNLSGVAFPTLLTDSIADEVLGSTREALESAPVKELGDFQFARMSEMTPLDRQALVEKHLISRELAEEANHSAVAVREDEMVSIMVNEEDHLRIQCIMPGFRLEEAWTLASKIDDALEETLSYAFDNRLGYLTACPTNVGTGLRASVMMHLPGLVLSGQINRMLAAISQVGLAVRGLYGEGSESAGNLFQVSNQVTLGESEEEIIQNLRTVVDQLIDHERSARRMLLNQNRTALEDRVCRSFGVLAYARQIDSKEALERCSDVRLGIDMGMISGVSSGILKELMVMVQPAFLQKYYREELSPAERDVRRATLIRERLRLDDTEVR